VDKPEMEDYLENWCICGRVILKWIVSTRDGRVWIGLKTGPGLGSLDILLDTILKLWVSLYR
jgi:hypothetical protein